VVIGSGTVVVVVVVVVAHLGFWCVEELYMHMCIQKEE
jgi:hypothetical protein